ncbi:MAG: hypothetical protein QOH91_4079, partial [Mycobacterium sp.]|nr:hypothetical protein [Mycobacterium sp.]
PAGDIRDGPEFLGDEDRPTVVIAGPRQLLDDNSPRWQGAAHHLDIGLARCGFDI